LHRYHLLPFPLVHKTSNLVSNKLTISNSQPICELTYIYVIKTKNAKCLARGGERYYQTMA
jgi:hypothetical protein